LRRRHTPRARSRAGVGCAPLPEGSRSKNRTPGATKEQDTMQRRRLSPAGPEVSALGYGLMSLSSTYGKADEPESIDAIHAALDRGITFFDTAEAYGGGHNERLAGRVLAPRRDEVVIATKFGLSFVGGTMQADGRPENVRRAIEGSLERLGIDTVDLYYLHRLDPQVPIEESVGAMAELVQAGKVRWLGLSEVSPATLRRAHAVHPITAVQSEYSLWTRDPEDGVLATCDELGIAFVPYSPLGRGFLSGRLRSRDDLGENDFRSATPRFDAEHFDANVRLADRLGELAARKGVTTGQLALAWLLHRGPRIVPIFGTRRRAHIEENAAAPQIRLDAAEIAEIEALQPRGAAAGDAAPKFSAHLLDR